MKIAVEGCAHGELDKIYEVLKHFEVQKNIKVDLLIICGDFQAVRNEKDLSCMAVPNKYKELNTFYKYHSGEKVAPVLTIFIGGNHEASNYLSELFYGGWVCPNIYYLGRAGVIRINGLRIAGLSGIYKGRDYLKGHFECFPFTEDTKRSVYHVRNLEVFRLKQLKEHIDIFISHDWPRGVYNYGNRNLLCQQKKFLRNEVESNILGSEPAQSLLMELKPDYWFAAHLHYKFSAVITHSEPKDNSDGWKRTRFLALDKCLPRRKFLQILHIGDSLPEGTTPVLEYDPEWLAILSSTNHLLNLTRQPCYMPGPTSNSEERWQFTPTDEEKKQVLDSLDSLVISPTLFEKTAASYNVQGEEPFPAINPQTLCLCKALGLTDPAVALSSRISTPNRSAHSEGISSEQISSDDGDEDVSSNIEYHASFNPDAIDLDEGGGDGDEDGDLTSKDGSGVEGLFVIDRRKSSEFTNNNVNEHRRSKLLLSSPKFSTPSISELSKSSVSNREQENTQGSECGFSATSDLSPLDLSEKCSESEESKANLEEGSKRLKGENTESETVPAPKRMMKRRNLNIYCSNDEENL